MKKMLQTNT